MKRLAAGVDVFSPAHSMGVEVLLRWGGFDRD